MNFHVVLTLSLLSLVVINAFSLTELYQSKKTLTSVEQEFDKLLSVPKKIQALEARLDGLENVTIRSLDSQLLDARIKIDLLKQKIISQKNTNPSDGK